MADICTTGDVSSPLGRCREAKSTHLLVRVLLAEDELELGFRLGVLELGLERDDDAVEEEVVELDRGREHALLDEVLRPAIARTSATSDLAGDEDSLLLSHVDLEAHDVAVLDLALKEGRLHLHQLDHVGLDLLPATKRISSVLPNPIGPNEPRRS